MAAKKKSKAPARTEAAAHKAENERLRKMLGDVIQNQVKSLKSLELALRETKFARQIVPYAKPCRSFLDTIRKLPEGKGAPSPGKGKKR